MLYTQIQTTEMNEFPNQTIQEIEQCKLTNMKSENSKKKDIKISQAFSSNTV